VRRYTILVKNYLTGEEIFSDSISYQISLEISQGNYNEAFFT